MVSSIELLNYVRQHLFIADNTLDTDLIAEDTDLVSFGIDSIQLLQLIAKIEKEFGVSLSLEKLANNSFQFSIKTLLLYIE